MEVENKKHTLKSQKSNLKVTMIFWIGLIFGLIPTLPLFAQIPQITIRFANPVYNCTNEEYCLDVEFQSDTPEQRLFGMNVRFFYSDSALEFIDFRDFQGGYAPTNPNPPEIITGVPISGPTLFSLTGPAEFVNGAIQLINQEITPIEISTTGWTKIFQVCFDIVDPNIDISNFCPSLIWDLKEDPDLGGFIIGDEGVVMTVVNQESDQGSYPAKEVVEQFNWQYDGVDGLPYGFPLEDNCIATECGDSALKVEKSGRLISATPGSVEVGDYIEYLMVVRNTGDISIKDIGLSDLNADPESINCTKDFLSPGEYMVCSATHTITQSDIERGKVANIALVNGVDLKGEPVSAESNEAVISLGICTDSFECVDFTFVTRFDFGDGRTQLCFNTRINCNQPLESIAFEVKGQVAFPRDGTSVDGDSETRYRVVNPTDDPYPGSLKYETIGEGIKDGVSEKWCFIIPTSVADEMAEIRIMAVVGNEKYEVNLDLRNCNGVVEKGIIAGRLFVDANNSGCEDEDEAGIEAVPVVLYDSAMNVVSIVLTDKKGQCFFLEIIEGDYQIDFTFR